MKLKRLKLPKKEKLKIKKITYKKAKGLADKWFSIFIRLRDSDDSGEGRCISCFKKAYWKELQNGHYISRSYLNTRFDGQNCWSQCPGCNLFKNGNMPEYTLALQERFGYGIVQELVKRSQKLVKYPVPVLLDMAEKFKKDAETLAKSKGLTI